MQACWHLQLQTVEKSCLSKNIHIFLKNCPQAVLACLRLFPCLHDRKNDIQERQDDHKVVQEGCVDKK